MKAIIVSDLHIGSPYFLHEEFKRLLENIPHDFELILNGDIIDDPYSKLSASHQRTVDLIEQLSHRQKVVWIRGNHDNGCFRAGFGKVHLKHIHVLEQRLMITHGDDFDRIMPKSRVFMKAFTLMHNLRIKLGAKPVHVAQYAKKWYFLYRILCKSVMTNAVSFAMKNGCEAVACGHTHYAEDTVFEGIRYINTGAWTESPAFYLSVTDDEIALKRIIDSVELRAARTFKLADSRAYFPAANSRP